jgi:hypothetical protein
MVLTGILFGFTNVAVILPDFAVAVMSAKGRSTARGWSR